jgi:iron complex outermembrane receptor protein
MQKQRKRKSKQPLAGLLWLLVAATMARGQAPVMDTVLVTGSRLPQIQANLTRTVRIIDGEELKSLPVQSIQEALAYGLGVDLQTRGTGGAQNDLAMRGSTFEQALVLVDGVRVNDKQTGHHNLDLAVPLAAVERIEILPGHGSSVYGPAAFGGVVNIVTKKTTGPLAEIHVSAADFRTGGLSVRGAKNFANITQSITLESTRSNGHRRETDFRHKTALAATTWQGTRSTLGLQLGYMDKDFGAYDFYTPGRNFASREQTATSWARLSGEKRSGTLTLRAHVANRRHHDTFQLFPGRLATRHTTHSFTTAADLTFDLGAGRKLVAGGEAVLDQIRSSGLGRHEQERLAVFSEYQQTFLQYGVFNSGLRMDHAYWGTIAAPSAGLSWWIDERVKVRAAAGRAFRAPSFTELYYQDPINHGNSALKPEQAESYELGAEVRLSGNWTGSTTVFLRQQHDLIDWSGATLSGPWYVQNIGDADMRGWETGCSGAWRSVTAQAQYTLMSTQQNHRYISKYALRYPVHQLTGRLNYAAAWGLTPGLAVLYKQRNGEGDYWLLNSKVTKIINKNISFNISATNLLNERYEEIMGVPQPGRWVGGGVEYKLKGISNN